MGFVITVGKVVAGGADVTAWMRAGIVCRGFLL